MAEPLLKVIVNTPDANIPRARGFYQMEEDALYFPLESGQERTRYFSFLDSDDVSLQLDNEGRLIFVEVSLPRRRWKIEHNLVAPEDAQKADIRFLDFRHRFTNPELYCNPNRDALVIRFGPQPASDSYLMADNLIAQLDQSNCLVALWLSDFYDDRAGKKISSWRKSLRLQYFRGLIPAA